MMISNRRLGFLLHPGLLAVALAASELVSMRPERSDGSRYMPHQGKREMERRAKRARVIAEAQKMMKGKE